MEMTVEKRVILKLSNNEVNALEEILQEYMEKHPMKLDEVKSTLCTDICDWILSELD